MDAIIAVDHLTKRYKKASTPAVDDISFQVAPGELFAFLGPNGAGKTTTISILTTTLAKTSGTVTIAGHDLDRETAAVRREIGIIFQKPSIDTHLSGEENIRLHVALYGVYGYRPFYRAMPAEYRQRIEHLADVVGLGSDLFRPLKTFSGGMTRKLEIVRSLMHRPAVLFLDEPTSGLDPISRRGLWTTSARSGTRTARPSSSRRTTSTRPRRPTGYASSTTARSRSTRPRTS
jgi:ABC-2 type transport system ATP-binding protein